MNIVQCLKFESGKLRRVPKTKEKQEALAIRIPLKDWEVLQVAMVLKGCRSMQELVAPVVMNFAKKMAEVPEVQTTLRQKREFVAREAGTLKRLKTAKGTRPASR